MRKETLEIKLAQDGMSMRLIGSMSPNTIPDKLDTLVAKIKKCGEQAIQNYHQHHDKKVLVVDFQQITKITTVGFTVLAIDVQSFVVEEKQAQLKFINFPKDFKAGLEIMGQLYTLLTTNDHLHFRE